MMTKSTQHFSSTPECLQFLKQTFGARIRLAAPLGLGKPNELLNALYDEVKSDPARTLEIFTALSLDLPSAESEIEKRFLEPFLERHFGKNYPSFHYVKDRKKKSLPANIRVQEFYFQAGQAKHIASAQEDYVSLNYTHVAPFLLEKGLDVIIQLIAKKEVAGKTEYSLSCNPDLTLDVVELYKRHNKELLVVGVIHPELPFIGDDAIVPEQFFAAILEDPHIHKELFAVPRSPINSIDHLIGLHASQLVDDGGTLQIGIGSLSEALVHSLCLRHKKNTDYENICKQLWYGREQPKKVLHRRSFEKGLYGTSEMVMDGFMHLRKAGILTREIHEPEKDAQRYLHGAFFLGSKDLYQWLRHLPEKDFAGLNMTRVSKVNDLYDSNEKALRRQRHKARFFNTCMNVTLLGAAASDTLPNGQVISGVGGQYNFVAMSYELENSHSILMLRSARADGRKRVSNIVWSHGQLTIPRHLRDIVITEYGIAFLKGRSDQEVIKALLNITDSEFQEELKEQAIKNGKLDPHYEIPDWAQQNHPERLQKLMAEEQFKNLFPAFPFGSDFTEIEESLVVALAKLQRASHSFKSLIQLFRKGSGTLDENILPYLERMQLAHPRDLKEWVYKRLVAGALISTFSEESH